MVLRFFARWSKTSLLPSVLPDFAVERQVLGSSVKPCKLEGSMCHVNVLAHKKICRKIDDIELVAT
jgi:hypothetical protein